MAAASLLILPQIQTLPILRWAQALWMLFSPQSCQCFFFHAAFSAASILSLMNQMKHPKAAAVLPVLDLWSRCAGKGVNDSGKKTETKATKNRGKPLTRRKAIKKTNCRLSRKTATTLKPFITSFHFKMTSCNLVSSDMTYPVPCNPSRQQKHFYELFRCTNQGVKGAREPKRVSGKAQGGLRFLALGTNIFISTAQLSIF